MANNDFDRLKEAVKARARETKAGQKVEAIVNSPIVSECRSTVKLANSKNNGFWYLASPVAISGATYAYCDTCVTTVAPIIILISFISYILSS